jgi:hypothetical protein
VNGKYFFIELIIFIYKFAHHNELAAPDRWIFRLRSANLGL